jgi:hypothetical protein
VTVDLPGLQWAAPTEARRRLGDAKLYIKEKALLRQGFGGRRWAQLGSNQRPPDYELQMRVSIDLHRFVSLCTSLFCNRIIVKDFTDLY